MTKHLGGGLLLMAAVTFLAGCGDDKPLFDVGLVTGKVTYNGQPVEGALIQFMPANGKMAMGKTDANGMYSLDSIAFKGCGVGTAKVMVKKTKEVEVAPVETDFSKAPAGGKPQGIGDPTAAENKPAAPDESNELLPPKYASFETSGITKEVKAGENVIDIELTD